MLVPGKFESRVRNEFPRTHSKKWLWPELVTPRVSHLLHWGRPETSWAGQVYTTFPVSDVTLFTSFVAACSCLLAAVSLIWVS